jgi:hypothetical protein
MKKICLNCSREFETNTSIKKFCSNDCYKNNHKQNYFGKWYKNSREKLLANPDLYQIAKEKNKLKQRKIRLEIKKDPEKYKKQLEKYREEYKKYFLTKTPQEKSKIWIKAAKKYRETEKGAKTRAKWEHEYRSSGRKRKHDKIYKIKYFADPENKKKYREWCRVYQNKRYKTDLKYRIRLLTSSIILRAVKRQRTGKSKSTEKLVGCSFKQLLHHLETQFKDGMSWNNMGKWEIDHIIPCASFDLTKKEEQEKCFHWTNLQPLWAKENRIKQAQISEVFGNTPEQLKNINKY